MNLKVTVTQFVLMISERPNLRRVLLHHPQHKINKKQKHHQ